MKVTIYGGPRDGESFEVPNSINKIRIPLPVSQSLLDAEQYADSTYRSITMPIKKSINYGYIAVWAEGKLS